ncbi:tyrosine-protein kinase SRK2-like [Haliotis rubra]|uniref:tyrosine-protein kinase SRK2-like n=1 Tax=Haliotis rubra TaxID=36100 RepID=UPI001EE5BBD6|nr:tyrosine-protein kinase SRK2-like [Haliotis rubra]
MPLTGCSQAHNSTAPVIYLALYDFEGSYVDDLSFKKGDRLRKVDADETSDWVVCVNLTNDEVGYIPTNYMKVENNSPETQVWWFACTRERGEQRLLKEGLTDGTFLVRPTSDTNSYTLSVRWHEGDGAPCVKHYKLRMSEDGQTYIGLRKMFPTVNMLIAYYQVNDDGLVCRLTTPCPRIVKAQQGSRSVNGESWWFDAGRHDAEALLLKKEVVLGSFLIRPSAGPDSYALSVRLQHGNAESPFVKHYKIQTATNGQVYIGIRKMFSSIHALVAHHRGREDGLACRLTEPCPRMAPVVHLRNMEVDRSHIDMTVKLGSGYFGEVWKGTLNGKRDIAVKKLKPGRMTVDEFMTEARIMNQLRHIRLVQLLAVCTDCEPVLLVTEYMSNGSLLDFLRKTDRPKLEHSMMIHMCRQIAEGMAFLESHNFIHRDLRAGNILVGEHYDVKVADFGLARIVDDGVDYLSKGSRVPIKWTAPEGIVYRKFSIKSDVWSFGVLMFEVATSGKDPYAGMKPPEVLEQTVKGYRLPKPQEHWLPEQIDPYYEIMQQCWKEDPASRPSFSHLHSVFEDFKVQTETPYDDI